METVSLKDSRTKGEKSLRLVFASGSDGGCQLQVLNLMGGTKGTAESSTSSTTPRTNMSWGRPLSGRLVRQVWELILLTQASLSGQRDLTAEG